MVHDWNDKRTRVGIVREDWENPNFVSYPTQFIHSLLMECEGKRVGTEGKKVRTQGKVKQ